MAKKRKKRSFSWQGALAGLGQSMVASGLQAQRAAQQQAMQDAQFRQQLELDRIRAAREAERNRVLDARAEQDFLLRQQGLQATQDYQSKMLEGTLGKYKADNDRLQQELNWKIEQANRLEAQRKADEAEALEFNADLAYGSEPVAPLFPLPANNGLTPEAPAPPIAPLPAAGGMPMGAMPAQMPAQQAEMPALPPYQAYQRRPYPKSADKPHERIAWDKNEDRREKQHNDNFDRQVNYVKTAWEMRPKPAPAEDSIGKKDIVRDLNDRIDAIEKDMLELQALESEIYGTWTPEDKAKRMADLKAEKEWLIGKKQELGFPVYTPPQPTRTPTPAPSPAPTPAPTRSPELQAMIQQKLQQGESPEIIERAIQIMQGQ